MRYLVNGEEADLSPDPSVEVSRTSEGLVVRTPDGAHTALAVRNGDSVWVSYRGRVYEVERASAAKKGAKGQGTGDAHAPMPGQVVEVFVERLQQVQAGDKLLVLEAMKMQHAVVAPFPGQVTELPVAKGDQVDEGQLLVRVEAVDE